MKSLHETPSATIDRYIQGNQPFAIISKQGSDDAHFLSGEVHQLERLADIPRSSDNDGNHERFDTLSVIPFS